MEQTFKHSFKVQHLAELALVVYNVGFQKCSSADGWGPGVRDHYLIHYVVSGRGRLEVHGQTHTLESGTAFLVRPDVPVHYEADESDPWEYYWVGFAGAAAPLFLNQTGFAHSDYLTLDRGDTLRRALLDIYKARGSDYPSAVKMAGYLQAALGGLMSELPTQEGANFQRYARRGAELIHQNYSQPLTVETMAQQVGVSRSYLCRAFQGVFHQSPRDYLIQYRIQRACQLLRHSDLPVKAVATSVGFEDHLYFSRAFRRVMDTTPTQYRGQGDENQR